LTLFFLSCGLALLSLVLALVIKKDSPVLAFLLTLAAGIVLIYHAIQPAEHLILWLRQTFTQSGMEEMLYIPVLKTMIIAVTVRIVSALCKDAGQSALAVKIEIIGAATALALSLPLLEQVLQLLGHWMG